MSDTQSIEFRVFPSPETNDHEVRIFVDGRDVIEQLWPDMMGMDPDDVLSMEVLAPRVEPHAETVVRCGCGVVGCGWVAVTIRGEGDKVIWDSWDGDSGAAANTAYVFERTHYLRALESAIEDKSWETLDRTAARLLSTLVDREALASYGLKYQWASGRIGEDVLTVSLEGPKGHHQILVNISWGREQPEEIARKAAEVLKKHPSLWPDVCWYGDSPTPLFKGKGWRR